MKKNILATNDITEIDFEKFKEEVKEIYGDLMEENEITDDFVMGKFGDYFEWDLDDLRTATKNHKIDILVIADLGLWDGRQSAYKMFTNFSDIFYSECDYVTWYIDSHKNLRFEGVHHDGRNHYLYRIMNDVSVRVLQNFQRAIYTDKNVDYYIKKYTKSLGRYYLENCT